MEEYVMEMIRRTSVFLILAQAVVHFRPNPSYEKYFKFLVGIMTIVMFLIPMLEFFQGGVQEQYRACMNVYMDKLADLSGEETELAMSPSGVYLEQMGEEIKAKLSDCAAAQGYCIQKAEILGISEEQETADTYRIKVSVKAEAAGIVIPEVAEIRLGEERKSDAEDSDRETAFQEAFADVLGVESGRLEVEIIE